MVSPKSVVGGLEMTDDYIDDVLRKLDFERRRERRSEIARIMEVSQ